MQKKLVLPHSLHDLDFAQQRALVRVDFNVPLNSEGIVTDDNRIRSAIPTIEKIIGDGGSCVLIAHLGRPGGKPDKGYSLMPVREVLEKRLGRPVWFCSDCVGSEVEERVATLPPGGVLLLENLRFHKEEKAGDPFFAKRLARLGQVYVNDAFGTAHRAHASVAQTPLYFERKCMGITMHNELMHAHRLLYDAVKPFVVAMGGAKVSDKIKMIDRLLDYADEFVIGGGMAYTFCRAQGGEVGDSLLEHEKLDLTRATLQKAKKKGVQLHLPTDSIAARRVDSETPVQKVDSYNIPSGWRGLDIGPDAQRVFSASLLRAKTILWNGPMGVFEWPSFEAGTRAVAEAIVRATAGGAFSLVGGGDSSAALAQFSMTQKVSYVSTGGGAMLACFSGTPLPAVEALLAGYKA